MEREPGKKILPLTPKTLRALVNFVNSEEGSQGADEQKVIQEENVLDKLRSKLQDFVRQG